MTENSPLVSVVILNWNTRALLEKFLPVVLDNSNHPNVEIVVADNGSSDDSVKWLRENHPEVRVIALSENYGFAGGYNKALAEINSEFSVLLNSDVAPAKGWINPLLKTIQENPQIAGVSPKIKDYANPSKFEYAGAAGGFIDRLGYSFCRGRIFNILEEDNGQYDTGGKIFWGSGAALMLRTALYNSTGGLDNDFFAHMEEIDWCWCVKNMGYDIIYVPESEVFHVGGGTLSYNDPKKNFLNFRNNLFLLVKNKHGISGWITIIIRLLFDYVAVFKFLASGEINVAKSVLSAHCDFFKKLNLFRKKRKSLKSSIIKKHHPEIYRRSIVFDFFIKSRKFFTQLSFKDYIK